MDGIIFSFSLELGSGVHMGWNPEGVSSRANFRSTQTCKDEPRTETIYVIQRVTYQHFTRARSFQSYMCCI